MKNRKLIDDEITAENIKKTGITGKLDAGPKESGMTK